MKKWKPIDIAPHDGTSVLVCVSGYDFRDDLGCHPVSAQFKTFHPNAPGKGAWRNLMGHKVFPTHWMELPPGPKDWEVAP